MKPQTNWLPLLLALALMLLIKAACGQSMAPATALPAVVVTQLPTLDYGQSGYVIQRWTANGILRAQQVTTNWTSKAVVSILSPKAGGAVTNYVTTFTLGTNAVIPLRGTNGGVYAYVLQQPAPVVRQAYVIKGLRSGTSVTIMGPVGWWCDSEPSRFFQTNGALSLSLETFTNQ